MNPFDDGDDFLPIAVEGSGRTAAEGTAAAHAPGEPDPDWQPL